MVFHCNSPSDKEDHISSSVLSDDMGANTVGSVVPTDMTLCNPSHLNNGKQTQTQCSEKGLVNQLQSFPQHTYHEEQNQQAAIVLSSEMTPNFHESQTTGADIEHSSQNSHIHIRSLSNPAYHESQTQPAEMNQIQSSSQNDYIMHNWLPDASSLGKSQECSGSRLVIRDLDTHRSCAQSSNSHHSCHNSTFLYQDELESQQLHSEVSCYASSKDVSGNSDGHETTGYNSLKHGPTPDNKTAGYACLSQEHICDSVNSHQCDICLRVFSTLVGVNIHKRVHAKYRPPFQCNICRKEFRRSSTLYQHKRKHDAAETQTSYTCKVCGKGFNFQSNLSTHMRVHTGYRPFECDVCDKSFTQSSALNCHRRIHTDERPFVCNFCGRTFRQSVGLTYHKRTHTGEKPYKCGLCGKAFSQWGPLSYHKRTHTGDRSYKCERV